MNPLSSAPTSQDYAAGYNYEARPRSVFDTVDDLALYRPRWLERCKLYQVRRSYYKGTAYDDWPDLINVLRLYSGIRQIFGPLRRAVRVDVAKVPGGWSLHPDLIKNNAHAAATAQIRAWSHAAQTYSAAVKYGAVAGEFGLAVIDDQAARTASIIALRPDNVVTGTLADGQPFGLIIKPGLVDRGGAYEYAQLWTPNTITTFRNGLQHSYDGHSPKRPNALRFVPVLLAPYLIGEDNAGECTFSGTQELLDRANDAASQALDVLQRNAEPPLVLSGVDESQVDINPENNAIVLSEADAKAYTIAPNLAIDQAIKLIDKVLAEFKNQLPQLIFEQLMGRSDLAYDTVLTLCSELTDHVSDVRRNVDAAIVQAEQWAMQAAKAMRVPAFAAVDPLIHALDDQRPIIQPTPGQAVQLEQQKLALDKAKREVEQSGMEQRPREGMDQAGAPMFQPTDLQFINAMIPHHETAIRMAETAAPYIDHAELQRVATAIQRTQRAEIDQMTAWRAAWYPDADAPQADSPAPAAPATGMKGM